MHTSLSDVRLGQRLSEACEASPSGRRELRARTHGTQGRGTCPYYYTCVHPYLDKIHTKAYIHINTHKPLYKQVPHRHILWSCTLIHA